MHLVPVNVLCYTVGRLESLDWRVDYILSSSQLSDVSEPCVQLQLGVQPAELGESQRFAFNMSSDKFRILLSGVCMCVCPGCLLAGCNAWVMSSKGNATGMQKEQGLYSEHLPRAPCQAAQLLE